jgi:hypothetical protein
MCARSRLWSWFLSFTTIGGLSQLHATDLRSSKAVWLVLFVTGAVLTAVNVGAVVRDFFAFPTDTSTSASEESQWLLRLHIRS